MSFFDDETNPSREIIEGIKAGEWVIVHPDETYGCMVGQVTAVDRLGTPEHDSTENDTDDIHVNFMALEYSNIRKAEFLEVYQDLDPNADSFDNLPLDDVIMAPDMLISLAGLNYEQIDALSESYKTAKAFCDDVLAGRNDDREREAIQSVYQIV